MLAHLNGLQRVRPGPSAAVMVGVAAALALTAATWVVPDMLGVGLLLPADRRVVLWTSRARVIAAVGVLCWAVACLAAWTGARRSAGPAAADSILLPLTLLPVSLGGFFLGPLVPQAAAANLLFFLPILLTATSLLRLLQTIDARGGGGAMPVRGAIFVGVGFWVFYALIGWYFTASLVKPPGDTGHYIVQAESLYRDHDLDLRNNLGPAAEKEPLRMHISRFSKGGRLYSWHSFGLPLLLAPFVPAGAPARHLILGLFSGLCCAGLWELCRLFGARAHWSLAAVLLFALSRYWGIYSSLCLPEAAGAALTAWGVVAVIRQQAHPRGSGWICVACCAVLPWLHTRFIPVSVAIFGIYLVVGVLRRDPWRPALLRLGGLTAAYGVTLAAFAAVELSMFAGGLPTSAGILFSYPIGMWYAVADRSGLLSVLPVFAGMIAAAVWILLRDPANRPGAATALLLTGVVLATSSSWLIWFGGATYPGRFLVVVVPLFVPCLARFLSQASPVARWWVLFLGLIPCFQFALVLRGLPEMGDLTLLFDHLNGLMEYIASSAAGALQPLALLLLGGTGVLFFLDPARRLPALAVTAAMILATAAYGDVANSPRLLKFQEKFNARRLAELGPRLEYALVQTAGVASPLDLFGVSNRYHREKLPATINGGAAAAPAIGRAGGEDRWVTVIQPFDAGGGWRAVRLTGRLTGGGAHLAVREGSETIAEEPLAAGLDGAVATTLKVRCSGRGQVSVAVRFEEDRGILENPVIAWTPFSEGLLERAGFTL